MSAEQSATDRIRPWVAFALARQRAAGQDFDWDMGLQLIGQDTTGHGENLTPTVVVQIWAHATPNRIAWFVHYDQPWTVDRQGVDLSIVEAFKGIDAARARLAAKRN